MELLRTIRAWSVPSYHPIVPASVVGEEQTLWSSRVGRTDGSPTKKRGILKRRDSG